MKPVPTLTANSPAPLGAYSRAIRADKFVYVSGQLGLLPGKSEPTWVSKTSAAEQTKQAMTNLGEVLKASGTSMDKVVKCTVMMANIDDFSDIDREYGKFFTENPPPARAAFAAATLPIGALVEIDAIALAE